MGTMPDLQRLRKTAYWSYHQDGLIDIFLGLVFLVEGIAVITNQHLLAGLSWMPVLLIAPMKRLITVPRMGLVNFKRSPKWILIKTGLVAMVLGILFLFVIAERFHFRTLDAWMHKYFLLVFGAAVALVPLVGALALGLHRFFAYAAAILTGFTAANFLHGSFPIVFILLGSMLVLVGSAVLIRFLHQYPLPEEES